MQIIQGNALEVMASMPAESVQCVVTSPPYWGLRKYAGEQEYVWGDNHCEHEWEVVHPPGYRSSDTNPGAIQSIGTHNRDGLTSNICSLCGAWRGAYGLEPTPELYVEHTILFLRAIRRVIRGDGVVWWNVGDSYNAGRNGGWPGGKKQWHPDQEKYALQSGVNAPDLKPKDLCLIPYRVALAAQADGWWVRSAIIWAKANPMPESVTDRPTDAYEHIFMLTKSSRYYFDQEAVREDTSASDTHSRGYGDGGPKAQQRAADGIHVGWHESTRQSLPSRNIRNVWNINTEPYPEAHFATFPREIPRRCIMASTSEKGNCSECGKPWVRVVEHKPMVIDRSSRTHELGRTRSSGTMVEPAETTTLGWQPSCQCNAPTQPAIVLDPFSGSGTTGEVAKSLGRKAILIDTSLEYCTLAQRRIEQVPIPMELWNAQSRREAKQ